MVWITTLLLLQSMIYCYRVAVYDIIYKLKLSLKIFIFIFIVFFKHIAGSKGLCTIDNILVYDSRKKNCIENDLLFGNLTFKSDEKNLNFIFFKDLNIQIPDIFNNEIKTFIVQNCKKEEKTLKLKTITNYNKINNNYVHKITISCIFKI